MTDVVTLIYALNIEKVEDTVLSLYNRIFKVDSPAHRLMQHLLSCFIFCGPTVPGTLLDRVLSMGKSPTKRAFNSQYISKTTVQTMLTQLATFYLPIILPSHIHMNIV